MNPARTLAWTFLAAALLAAGPAGAQIKLLLPEPESPFLTPGQRAELHAALKAKASDYPDLELVDAAGLDDLKARAGCIAGAEQILFTQVQRLPGRQMVILQLVDATTGRRLKQIRQRTRGGMAAVRRATGQAWVKLFGLRVDCRIEVAANMDDAEVFLDGQAVGQVPLTIRRKLRTGRHTVRVRHPDFLMGEKKFRAKAQACRAKLNFQLELKPKGDDIPPVALVGPLGPPPGPGAKLKDEGPKQDAITKDSGPAPGAKLKDEGPEPGTKLKDEGPEPGEKLKDESPTPGAKLKDESPTPGAKLKDESPTPGARPGDEGSPDTSIAGPLLRHKPIEPEPVVEKPFLPEDETPEPSDAVPVYKKWWFWTAVGAVALAGVVTGTAIGLSSKGNDIPSGKGRVTIQF